MKYLIRTILLMALCITLGWLWGHDYADYQHYLEQQRHFDEVIRLMDCLQQRGKC